MDRQKSLETALAIAGGLLVLFAVFRAQWLLFACFGIIFVALFLKSTMLIISTYWMKLSHVLGAVMSKVILSLVFFLVVTPVAMLRKLLSEDKLHLKKPPLDSLFDDRGNHTYRKEDLANPW